MGGNVLFPLSCPVPWFKPRYEPICHGVEAWRPKFCNFQAFVTQLLEAEVEAGIYVYILSNGQVVFVSSSQSESALRISTNRKPPVPAGYFGASDEVYKILLTKPVNVSFSLNFTCYR